MVTPYSLCLTPSLVKGRQRRLLYEWEALRKGLADRSDIRLSVTAADSRGIPTAYQVDYFIKSICGIGAEGRPLFASHFVMQLMIPDAYPEVDAPPVFQFIRTSEVDQLPWHPNIRYEGEMAGMVCINRLNTFTDLVWGVVRVADYLRYERYHAKQEPPYPEDLRVAQWVRQLGEPNGWIYFDQV